MFYQHNVYPATEYGTRECREDREPCGAFYGLPYSGEVKRPAFANDAFAEYLPDTRIYVSPIESRRSMRWKNDIYMGLVTESWTLELPKHERALYKEYAKQYAYRDSERALRELHRIYKRYMERLKG